MTGVEFIDCLVSTAKDVLDRLSSQTQLRNRLPYAFANFVDSDRMDNLNRVRPRCKLSHVFPSKSWLQYMYEYSQVAGSWWFFSMIICGSCGA